MEGEKEIGEFASWSKQCRHKVDPNLCSIINVMNFECRSMTCLGESIDEGYDLHFRDAHLQQKCVDILVYLKDEQ